MRVAILLSGHPVAGILLRCPTNVLGFKKPSSLVDRCHSLASLHLPPAALGSLPRISPVRILRPGI